MRVTLLGRLAMVVGVSLCAAAGAMGCLSSSDASAPNGKPGPDAGSPVTTTPVLDASGSVTAPTPDAAPPSNDDAGKPTTDDDGGPIPIEAGPPEAGPPTSSQVGLVGGGTLSRSAHYVLVGSTGPATAPVLKSSSYRLTGGMGASTQK